ncbi:MAG: RNA 2',3'-cyclic phosphodiesterase [Dehalococcoidia bacterium]|nr:RNA 2',3'-cyclic phosphodiesterase [Dehalococcoidia bacterium]MDP7484582.1 RNA 2',3'-cyclic phosphodiesterase [Dehalococcoidia bacterium]
MIGNIVSEDARVTKSNDRDPWLGGEAEKKPDATKPKDTTGPEPEETPVAEEVDAATGSPTDEKGAASEAPSEFVPTEVPDRDPSRGEETYYGGRSGSATGFTRQSEAKYVASEPKLYVAPNSEDDDQEEQSGFPEVPENTHRLFIAIEIPRKLKRDFADLAKSFRPREFERVRWIEEEAMHLTLKFLGDTPADQVHDIKKALERTAESTGKFTIKIGRTGCFPSFRDPRICWVGVSGELRRLEQLQGRVEGGMVALGLDEDDRDFKAHITVGRTRPGIRGRFAEDIGVSWQHAPLHTTGQSVLVNAITLYRSFLNDKDDTEYQQLANFELG